MTLRNKTLAFIGLTLLVLLMVLFSITRSILQTGFKKVEKDLITGFSTIELEDAQRNVSRVLDGLKMKIDNLSVKASDWARWDDTYKFIVDHNKTFIESNLVPDGLISLKINAILLYNLKGELVVGIGLDLDKGEEAPISENLRAILTPSSPLIKFASPEEVKSGLILLKEGPLMFASLPILKSDATGPVRGAIIFARYLDSVEFDNLSSITHLSIAHCRVDQNGIPGDFQTAQASLSPDKPILINPLDEKTISGYTQVSDLFDKAALLLRVDIPRDIHKQGIRTVSQIRERNKITLLSLVVSILVSGMVLGLVILLLLERLVLSRIGRLSYKTVEIGATGDFSGRVEEDGKDEIYSLASSINKMLSALSRTHQEIESRNAEMRLLMNTIPAGLLSIDENFQINPEYSRSAQQMLCPGQDLKGKPFAEILGFSGARKEDGAKLLDYLTMLRQELAPESTMAELNPFNELKRAHPATGEDLFLRIQFFLIRRGEGQMHHILVVFEDITEEKRLALEVDKSHKENLQLKAIAEDSDLFREFLLETRNILYGLRPLAEKLSPDDSDPSALNEIFRGVHTIKGVAGSFGLFEVAEMAGQLEDELETLRTSARLSAGNIENTRSSLKKLEASFNQVAESAKRILGEEIEGGGIFLRIPLEELKRHMQEIRAMTIDDNLKDKMIGRIKEEILLRLQHMRTVSARKGLARSLKIVPGLIERLGKNIRFEFEGQDILIDCEIAHELNTPLIHLIRNALDHGIESPEERLESGKTEQGSVTLTINQTNGSLMLRVADDGAGLDSDKLKRTAVKKGFITESESRSLTEKRCFDLIFRPGFSTVEKVTSVSGRGVGMDAVLQSVRDKLHGEIQVESLRGRGTSFTLKIPA
jgi:sensor domain CHASE-containing protein/signal transduction histidine kinase/HAMP domain-containing protein